MENNPRVFAQPPPDAGAQRPRIMGILNVTPDSFSDGGRYLNPGDALNRAASMVEEGADLIDVGGESTRPGARPVPADEQLRRVIPVIEGMAGRANVPISIDTRSARVAREAVAAGASIVNDVSALRADPHMAAIVADTGASVVLMHMLGEPATMQHRPVYEDVVSQVSSFLARRAAAAAEAGIAADKIMVDPGVGFGKTGAHNLEIIANLDVFRRLGFPVLVGPSRKAFIGEILGVRAAQRLEGTAAAVALAVAGGADVLRVHDVRAMTRVARVAWAIRQARNRDS